MKRIMTISMALSFILISGLTTMATASTNQEQVQQSSLFSQRTEDCKGDQDDACK